MAVIQYKDRAVFSLIVHCLYRIGQPPWYFHFPFFSISNVARILENPTWFCGLSVPSFSPAETLASHEQKTMSFDLGIPRKRNIVSESALSI